MTLETPRREGQRERLRAAEIATFAHHGVEATSEPLPLADPALTTRVVRVGSGPPVVLLHGGAMTATVWAPLLPHLPGRTLHLVDLPGCGLSDPFDFTGVDLAAHQSTFVASVLDALGLERAPIIGASMGGWYALRTAVDRPERVSALVAITAPAVALPGARMPTSMAFTSTWLGRRMGAVAPPPSARMMRRMLASIGGRASVAEAPEALFEVLGAATYLAGPSYATLDVCRWRTPHPEVQLSEAELAACATPTLLLWGDRDVVQDPASAAVAAEALPNGRLEVLAGGHGLWFEHPQRCGELITGFLRDAVPRQG